MVTHAWYRIYSLSNRSRLADTAGLDDDIVELLKLYDIAQLLDQIHLERTADTAVLKSHEGVILLLYYPTLFYKVSINIHLTDVVDDDGKSDTFFIIKNTIQERCLAASQITG